MQHLAVGMAPELLPAVMTFSMSAGANRMLRKKVIVKRLASMFNLGEVNVLCTDKTGTLTQGISKVRDIVDIEGNGDRLLQLYAFLNASLQKGFTNPLDQAIASLDLSVEGWEKVNEVPYDFIRKRLSISVEKNGRKLLIMKGRSPMCWRPAGIREDPRDKLRCWMKPCGWRFTTVSAVMERKATGSWDWLSKP